MQQLRQSVKWVLERAAPGYINRIFVEKMSKREKEIELLPLLVGDEPVCVDVGANRGLFVHHLRALGKHVVAFEPLPPMQAVLRRTYPGLRLEAVALSDAEGFADIRYPAGNHSWATLARSNQLELAEAEIRSVRVPLRTLDSYGFDAVGFVKIDVEGHEEAVLSGGAATLARCMPKLLIEIEERHNPGSVARAVAWLRARGYACFFVDDGALSDFDRFDAAKDQPLSNVGDGGKIGRYANNFLFVPVAEADGFRRDADRILGG